MQVEAIQIKATYMELIQMKMMQEAVSEPDILVKWCGENQSWLIIMGLILAGFFLWRMILYIRFSFYRFMTLKRVDRMEGTEFEAYLGYLFRKEGYRVRMTKATGDFGADLILYDGKKKIAVQAKRYEKPVGVSAVQQVLAAKQFYECDEAMVVSNREYTRQAKQLAAVSDVVLIDREALVEKMGKKQKCSEPEQEALQPEEEYMEIAFHAKVFHENKNFQSEKIVYAILQEALEDHGYDVDGD